MGWAGMIPLQPPRYEVLNARPSLGESIREFDWRERATVPLLTAVGAAGGFAFGKWGQISRRPLCPVCASSLPALLSLSAPVSVSFSVSHAHQRGVLVSYALPLLPLPPPSPSACLLLFPLLLSVQPGARPGAVRAVRDLARVGGGWLGCR